MSRTFCSNYNPIGLHIGNEIVSILLTWGRNRCELRTPSYAVDCHDLKIKERSYVNRIVHNI